MPYTEEEILLALNKVAGVKDLNSVTISMKLGDILPDYPDDKMLEWPIGAFLADEYSLRCYWWIGGARCRLR